MRTSVEALEHSYRDSDDEEVLVEIDDAMTPEGSFFIKLGAKLSRRKCSRSA